MAPTRIPPLHKLHPPQATLLNLQEFPMVSWQLPLETGITRPGENICAALTEYYLPAEVIKLDAMKSFSCQFLYIKLLLKKDIFLSSCWQPCFGGHV